MERPLVTIVSPSYNHSKFIIESLDSIRRQTYSNIQHIIIDDCSTDDSADKIEKWIAEHNYECTFIRHQENKGVSFTLNQSISLAEGKYWTGLATDDVAALDRTEKLVDYLENHSEVPMVVSNAFFINNESKKISHNGFEYTTPFHCRFLKDFDFERDYGMYQSLLSGNYFTSSFLLRKGVFSKTGLYDETLGLEDWDMWLRISRVCGRIHYLDEPLTYYRIHATNSINNDQMLLEGHLKTFLRQKQYCRSGGNKIAFEKKFSEINRVNIKNLTVLFNLFSGGGFFLALKTTFKNIFSLVAKKMKLT